MEYAGSPIRPLHAPATGTLATQRMTALTAEAPIRLVLHPGHPKCGSSSIQAALYGSVDALEARGVFLPNRRFRFSFENDGYRRGLGNPVNFFEGISNDAGFAAFEERLAEVLTGVRRAGGRTVVISAENLGNQSGITTRRPLHEIFARRFRPVDVIFYIRRQDDWMVSSWQQWGHKLGWSLERHIDQNLADNRPDFLAAARSFEAVYGEGRVSVVPLDRRTLMEGDLLADFSRRSGLPLGETPEEDTFKNASLGGFLCDVLARAPGIYTGHRDQSVRRLLAGSPAARGLAFNSDKRILSAAQRRRVLQHFEDDNRALHARYFPEARFEDVFAVPATGADEEIQTLRDQVDGLKDVVAVQMAVLLDVLEPRERKETEGLVVRLLRKLRASRGRT